jgi:hypothetical protein
MNEKLKSVGGGAAGAIILLAFLSLPFIFIYGAVEFSIWALDWIPDAIGWLIIICLPIAILCLFPFCRGFSSNFFGLASFAFGFILWIYCLAYTYTEWGLFGVIVGVVFFGIGVVLTGLISALLSGAWIVLGNIAFLLGLYIVARLLSGWMAYLNENRRLLKSMEGYSSDQIVIPASRD